jgi:hypothetical protein
VILNHILLFEFFLKVSHYSQLPRPLAGHHSP